MTVFGWYLLGAGLIVCGLALLLSLCGRRRARVVPPAPVAGPVVYRSGRWPALDQQVVRPARVEATAMLPRTAGDGR